MGSVNVHARRGGYRCEVVDIQAELKHWKDEIHTHAFHDPGTPFPRYEPVLRFAYDCYLRHYAQPLEDVLDTIHHKYVECFDQWHVLAWPRMEELLAAVWTKMGAPVGRMNWSGQGSRVKSALRLH